MQFCLQQPAGLLQAGRKIALTVETGSANINRIREDAVFFIFGDIAMEFIIRDCYISDVEAIWKLNSYEMEYDYPFEQTEDKLNELLRSDHDRIFVAVVRDEVVGYVHANDYDILYAPHLKNIMGIAVSSAYQKKGIGRALLQTVENWAKETGAAGVRLVSGEERTSAHKFYQSCGYINGKNQLNFKKWF